QIRTGKITSTNPATGDVLAELECASASSVGSAVARARSAQALWQACGVEKRVGILRRFQRALHAQKSEVATLITKEGAEAAGGGLVTEVLVVLDAVRFLIDTAYEFLRDQPVPHGSLAMKTKQGWIVREPHGVIAIVSPWNYPFSIPAVDTLAALVTGNAV